MLGLRLNEGIDLAAIDREIPGSRQRFASILERHVENGLIVADGSRLALSVRGALLSNEVFTEIISA
jgi:coproporphyrinogen III oxidase-like Fe-S oxidoreductase